MKRITVEGDWQHERDAFGSCWVLRRGNVAAAVVYDVLQPVVEDVSDPLPTEPGTVIEATVTYSDGVAPQYVERARFHLLPGFGDTAECPWRSERELYGKWWHRASALSDWTVVYDPEATP